MVKVIVAQTKHDCEHILGHFVDESHYDILVEEDTDCFMPPQCDVATQADCDVPRDCASCPSGIDERRVAFKFRKNWFTKEEQEQAYAGLRDGAIKTENRGVASGIQAGVEVGSETREWITNYQHDMMDAIYAARNAALVDEDAIDIIRAQYPTEESRKKAGGQGKTNVWVIERMRDKSGKVLFDFEQWVDSLKPKSRAERAAEVEKIEDYISSTTYGNSVYSGVAGFMDRYPRLPYGRATSYTKSYPEKFAMSFPFLQSLSRGFKELLPWRYNNQKKFTDAIDPRFVIPGTPFTTVTINKTFRTACHRDAGDFTEGMSNLLVLSNDGNYTGGYLVFPEYRVAVNVRPGDLLLVNNHEIIHGNTPIVLGSDTAERISLVCYAREKMSELGTFEYEQTRYDFIESRRTNKDHPEQRPRWNGISEGVWTSKEWYDWLLAQPQGREWLNAYHQDLIDKFEAQTLESFFG